MKEVQVLLARADSEDISNLSALLECRADPESIISAIQQNSMHSFTRVLGSEPPPYKKVLRQVADHVGADRSGMNDMEAEISIMQKLWGDLWRKLSPEQREQFDRKLRQRAAMEKDGEVAKISITGAGMLAANLGGFATYALASSIVGAITGAIGITLPFATYMALSSTIAAVIGPPGWLALGILAIWRLGKPDLERVTAAVCMIAMIRARQNVNTAPTTGFWKRLVVPVTISLIITILLIILWWSQQP